MKDLLGTARDTTAHIDVRRWNRLYREGHFSREWHYDRPSPELVAFLAAAGLRPGARVIDVGCGAGSDAICLAHHGYRVLAIDISSQALEIASYRARQAGLSIAFRLADVVRLPVPSGSAELVSDRGCFHHLEPAQRALYSRETYRVLRPGGALFLRGSRLRSGVFYPVDESSIDRHFNASLFQRGPVSPVFLSTNGGGFWGNLVVLRARSRPAAP